MCSEHVTVLLKETVDALEVKPAGVYVDMTLGRGGHSSLILSKLSFNGKLIGIDQDVEAIVKTKARLEKHGKKAYLFQTNFVNFEDCLNTMEIEEVDGFVFDLGVSSPQFDEGDRGFSYRMDARLDMRMDKNNPLDAYRVINDYSIKELTRVFRDYGEEKFAFQIAKNIVKAREVKPIETTFDLVEIIKKSLPPKVLEKKGHPAKQVFQAIRIEVNDELNVLESTLKRAINRLKIGGRCAVISFHSLEDKIVKDIFKANSFIEGDRLNFNTTKEVKYRLVNKKVIIPSDSELEVNPRSKSAKLRVIERIK